MAIVELLKCRALIFAAFWAMARCPVNHPVQLLLWEVVRETGQDELANLQRIQLS